MPPIYRRADTIDVVVAFIERATDDPVAHALLTEYFTSRELGFTGGTYRIVHPDPARFTPPSGLFLVVEDDEGTPVGCGGIRSLDPSRFEVKHLYLRPETRGRGWGGSLLRELERRAVELGALDIVLDTNSSLASAAALYRSAGYEDVEPYNDNPNADLWLRKVLVPRRRLMCVQLKTGFDTDRGPSWICWVDFNRTWKTAKFHGKELRRFQTFDANFYDVETHEDYWISGPKRDRTDLRYGPGKPVVDDNAQAAYEAFLAGGSLPGRENG